MARFILLVFLAATLFIVGINFLVGFVRRIFGFSPQKRSFSVIDTNADDTKPLYNRDGTVVYKGEKLSATEQRTDAEDHSA